MNYQRQRGFALGIILLVIALIAALTVAMVQTSGNFASQSNVDKAMGYAMAVKSHGGNLRDTMLNMVRSGTSISAINRAADCIGADCFKAKLFFARMPNDVFVAAPGGGYGFDLWFSNRTQQFLGPRLDVYILNQPIKPEICAAIETANRGTRVEIGDVNTVSNMIVASPAQTFDAAINWNPRGQDGCFMVTENESYYYYIIIGKAS